MLAAAAFAMLMGWLVLKKTRLVGKRGLVTWLDVAAKFRWRIFFCETRASTNAID